MFYFAASMLATTAEGDCCFLSLDAVLFVQCSESMILAISFACMLVYVSGSFLASFEGYKTELIEQIHFLFMRLLYCCSFHFGPSVICYLP